jgi:hypothetical protein
MTSSSGPGEEDPLQEARAYNNSILFMVTVPYLTLFTAGFLVYRGLMRREKELMAHPDWPGGPEKRERAGA